MALSDRSGLRRRFSQYTTSGLVMAAWWWLRDLRGNADWFGALEGPQVVAYGMILMVLALGAGAVLALVLGWVAWATEMCAGRVGWGRAALLPAALSVPVWVLVGQSVIAGAWVREQTWAPFLSAGVVMGGVIGCYILAHLAAGFARARSTGTLLAGSVMVAGLVGALHVVRFRPILGAYPVVQSAADGLALVLVGLWGFGIARHLPSLRGAGAILILSAGVVVGLLFLRALPGHEPAIRDLLLNRAEASRMVLGRFAEPTEGVTSRVDASIAAMLTTSARLPDDVLDRRFPGRRQYNVVLVTIDTLRADRCSFHGYTRNPTTPHIAAFSDDAVVFEDAWTQHPSSQLAMASLFTGAFPLATEIAHSESGPFSAETWPHRLQGVGFQTVGITALDRSLRNRLFPYVEPAFDRFRGAPAIGAIPADVVTDMALEELAEVDGVERPYFLWAHYFDPHDPYTPPSARFGSAAPRDLYDAEVAHCDAHVGRLLAAIQARPDADRTLVILHSDHGEEFLERGGRFHHSTLFEEQVHVPLVVKFPGFGAARIEGAVGLVDVADTVLELLGLPPLPSGHGRSFLARVLTPAADRSDAFTFAQFRAPERRMGRLDAYRQGPWKLIRNVSAGTWHLFNLEDDPEERRDLAPKRADVLEPLQARLMACAEAAVARLTSTSASIGELAPEALREAVASLTGAPWREALEGLFSSGRVVDVLPDLLQRLEDPEAAAEDRSFAALTLGVWHHEPAIPALLQRLENPDPILAKNAFFALCHFEDPRVLERGRALADLAHPTFEAHLLTVLRGIHGDEEVLPDLLERLPHYLGEQLTLALAARARLEQEDPGATLSGLFVNPRIGIHWFSWVAARAALRRASPRIWLALYGTVHDSPSSYYTVHQALSGLRESDLDLAIPILRSALGHRDVGASDLAVQYLKSVNREDLAAALKKAANRVGTPWIDDPSRLARLRQVVDDLREQRILDWGACRDALREAVLRDQVPETAAWIHQVAAESPWAAGSVRGLLRLLADVSERDLPARAELSIVAGGRWIAKDGRPCTVGVEVKLSPDGGPVLGASFPGESVLRSKLIDSVDGTTIGTVDVPLPPPGLLPGERAVLLVRIPMPPGPLADRPYRLEAELVGPPVRQDLLKQDLLLR